MANTITVSGFLGQRGFEIKQTANGNQMAILYVSESYYDRTEKKTAYRNYRVTTFNKADVESLNRSGASHKSPITVSGVLEINTTEKDGKSYTNLEITASWVNPQQWSTPQPQSTNSNDLPF